MIATFMLILAGPASAGELREPLMELLNAYEHGASAEDLTRLGDGVVAELLEIAADSGVPHSRRGRAVSALGHYPEPRVRSFLDAQLTGSDAFLQRKATGALAKAFRDDALPSLAPALEAEDAQLRLATVHAVGQLDSKAARDLLQARVRREKDDNVKSVLKSTLASMEAK
ncbi:MAG: HEAT repeat domain-containing protein [Alphaproteobacteria bacterium]|nr:HEAT repeat domain-containing protein [Alphaproteobacteria bacterium]